MSHISSIGAGIYSDLAIALPLTPLDSATLATKDTDAEFKALFGSEIENIGGTKASATFVRIKNVREFPAMGTPPNIVNVPTYGQKTSKQIQGQSDSPTMEITLNYVPADWASSGCLLGPLVGNGTQYCFRFTLLNAIPNSYSSTDGATSIGGVTENTQYYWIGKIEALLVNPQLTDANTATLTISVQSAFFGAYTTAAV